jgi:hypothetical protein
MKVTIGGNNSLINAIEGSDILFFLLLPEVPFEFHKLDIEFGFGEWLVFVIKT